MVPISKIEKGVAAYLDAEIMPKFQDVNGFERVLAGTALGLIIRRSGKIIESYKDNKTVQALGLMDAEGNVDVDVLAEELKKNIPEDGMKVTIPIIGGNMNFHKEDVKKLHEYITKL